MNMKDFSRPYSDLDKCVTKVTECSFKARAQYMA